MCRIRKHLDQQNIAAHTHCIELKTILVMCTLQTAGPCLRYARILIVWLLEMHFLVVRSVLEYPAPVEWLKTKCMWGHCGWPFNKTMKCYSAIITQKTLVLFKKTLPGRQFFPLHFKIFWIKALTFYKKNNAMPVMWDCIFVRLTNKA